MMISFGLWFDNSRFKALPSFWMPFLLLSTQEWMDSMMLLFSSAILVLAISSPSTSTSLMSLTMAQTGMDFFLD